VARRRAGSGAYIVQRGDGRGVPRADVRVERRRPTERLRAEAARGPRRREGLARSAPMRVRPNTHAPSQTHGRTRERVWCMHAPIVDTR
jgi:hypothetical protein